MHAPARPDGTFPAVIQHANSPYDMLTVLRPSDVRFQRNELSVTACVSLLSNGRIHGPEAVTDSNVVHETCLKAGTLFWNVNRVEKPGIKAELI